MDWHLTYRDQHSAHTVVIHTNEDDERAAVRLGEWYVEHLRITQPNPNQNYRYVGVARTVVATEDDMMAGMLMSENEEELERLTAPRRSTN